MYISSSPTYQQVEVKASFGDIRRRFLVKVEYDKTYVNLLNQIYSLFSLPQTFNIRLEYEDDEGDFITVSSEEEVRVAIQVQSRMFKTESPPLYPLLRLVITEKPIKKKKLTASHGTSRSSGGSPATTALSSTDTTISSVRESIDVLDIVSHSTDDTTETGTTASSDSTKTRRNRKKKQLKKVRVQAKKDEKERRKEEKRLEKLEKEKLKQQKLIEKELKKEELKLAKEQKRLEKELVKTDDYDLTKDWPKHIKYLYLDGNNMLFICSSFRKYSCKRSTRHYTEQILNAIALEFHNSCNIILTQVCYDKTASMPKHPGIDKLFIVTSAIPDFNTADDQLVTIAAKQKSLKLLDYSMFVTTDKLLRKRLKDMGAKVASPGSWLKCAHKYLSSFDLSISKNLDEWTDSFINRLNLPSFTSVAPDGPEVNQ